MISLKKWPWVLIGTVVSLALWTWVGIGTNLFITDDLFQTFAYVSSYILIIGFWGLFVLKLEISENIRKIIGIALFALTPLFCMQIAIILAGEPEYSFEIYFINTLFYASLMGIAVAVTRSFRVSSIITVSLAYLFNLASFVINILRGTPLIPGDFLAIGTAAQVAEHYTFQLKYEIIAATIVAAIVIALVAKFAYKPKFKYKNIILPVSGVLFAAIFFICLSFVDYTDIEMDFFDQYHANNTHGTAYSFYINVRRMILNKPEGYDSREVANFLASYDEDTSHFTGDKPNIIVVMNESFADMQAVGSFSTDSDYMPFVRTLENNTVKGEMLVSPFGGYTCNTEFEFLTGLTMGLLPAGSTPYLQYISTPFENAIPRHLSKLGYKSVALHPYYARCWNRELVYGCLGFDEFISLEKFDDLVPESDWEYVRYYMSDRTDYEAIKKCLEEKDKDKPLFLFNVTMQNHGGYTYDGPEFPTVTITDMQGTYPETEQYLSLIKESDDAFRELVDYLKGRKEKTIVVMFGDHQPAVEQQFFEELYGKPLLQLETEELQRRYKVPFVIWANYDIKEQKDVLTSTNYLSNLVLDAAGIPKTCIGNFTEELRDEVPRINGMGYYDNEGNWHDNEPKKPGKLRDYDYIEYYSLTNK